MVDTEEEEAGGIRGEGHHPKFSKVTVYKLCNRLRPVESFVNFLDNWPPF